jgi:hypothetical protein
VNGGNIRLRAGSCVSGLLGIGWTEVNSRVSVSSGINNAVTLVVACSSIAASTAVSKYKFNGGYSTFSGPSVSGVGIGYALFSTPPFHRWWWWQFYYDGRGVW